MSKLRQLFIVVGSPIRSRWFKFYFQRFFMNIRLRHWISSFIAYWIRISARKIEKFESRLDDFQTFDRDGFLYLGNLLSSADCSILHNFLKGCQVIQGTSDDNSDFIN